MHGVYKILGCLWGFLGITFLLGHGVSCLIPYVIELSDFLLNRVHYIALSFSVFLLGYAEGYKGFQLKFSPRAASRISVILKEPTYLRIIFAPFFCMGFFDSSTKRKILSYGLTGIIIVLIILVSKLPQPWRGIVDAGVLLGLSWGIISFWIFTFRLLLKKNIYVDPELG